MDRQPCGRHQCYSVVALSSLAGLLLIFLTDTSHTGGMELRPISTTAPPQLRPPRAVGGRGNWLPLCDRITALQPAQYRTTVITNSTGGAPVANRALKISDAGSTLLNAFWRVS